MNQSTPGNFKQEEVGELYGIEAIVSGAILDGQNQIHDLKSGKATATEVNDRMVASLEFWVKKGKSLLLAEADKATRAFLSHPPHPTPMTSHKRLLQFLIACVVVAVLIVGVALYFQVKPLLYPKPNAGVQRVTSTSTVELVPANPDGVLK